MPSGKRRTELSRAESSFSEAGLSIPKTEMSFFRAESSFPKQGLSFPKAEMSFPTWN
jgi:hypothetical protein